MKSVEVNGSSDIVSSKLVEKRNKKLDKLFIFPVLSEGESRVKDISLFNFFGNQFYVLLFVGDNHLGMMSVL